MLQRLYKSTVVNSEIKKKKNFCMVKNKTTNLFSIDIN